MLIEFKEDHGVFVKGKAYSVIEWVAKEFIAQGKAVEVTERGTDAQSPIAAEKVMRPAQVKRKGGL